MTQDTKSLNDSVFLKLMRRFNSTKNYENVKFYLLPKDKVKRKLWLNTIGRV